MFLMSRESLIVRSRIGKQGSEKVAAYPGCKGRVVKPRVCEPPPFLKQVLTIEHELYTEEIALNTHLQCGSSTGKQQKGRQQISPFSYTYTAIQ